MRSLFRFKFRVISAAFLAAGITACAMPGKAPNAINLDGPGEFVGKVVGPIQRGQQSEGTGFKSFELALPAAVSIDDKSDCGPQEVRSLPIEKEGMEPYVGKTVRLKASAYCRSDRTGTYHLREVSVH